MATGVGCRDVCGWCKVVMSGTPLAVPHKMGDGTCISMGNLRRRIEKSMPKRKLEETVQKVVLPAVVIERIVQDFSKRIVDDSCDTWHTLLVLATETNSESSVKRFLSVEKFKFMKDHQPRRLPAVDPDTAAADSYFFSKLAQEMGVEWVAWTFYWRVIRMNNKPDPVYLSPLFRLAFIQEVLRIVHVGTDPTVSDRLDRLRLMFCMENNWYTGNDVKTLRDHFVVAEMGDEDIDFINTDIQLIIPYIGKAAALAMNMDPLFFQQHILMADLQLRHAIESVVVDFHVIPETRFRKEVQPLIGELLLTNQDLFHPNAHYVTNAIEKRLYSDTASGVGIELMEPIGADVIPYWSGFTVVPISSREDWVPLLKSLMSGALMALFSSKNTDEFIFTDEEMGAVVFDFKPIKKETDDERIVSMRFFEPDAVGANLARAGIINAFAASTTSLTMRRFVHQALYGRLLQITQDYGHTYTVFFWQSVLHQRALIRPDPVDAALVGFFNNPLQRNMYISFFTGADRSVYPKGGPTNDRWKEEISALIRPGQVSKRLLGFARILMKRTHRRP